MKKTTIIVILGIAATIAVGFYLLGFGRGEAAETDAAFDLTSEQITYGSAADRTMGLYDVSYWLVQKGPWPNPALLQDFARFYWKETPDIEAVKEVVRVPAFKTRRGYVICDDCPVHVTVIRRPIKEGDVIEDEPEKPTKPTPPGRG